MTLWLDAQISPALAPWLTATCGIACSTVRDLGLRDAGDPDIFMAGRSAGVVIVTKDADFVRLLEHLAVSSIRPHAGACGRSQILPYRRRQTPSPWSSFQSNPIEMAAQ